MAHTGAPSGDADRAGPRLVLDGELAERARRRALATGAAMLELATAAPDPSLGGGSTGLALAHRYLAVATGDAAHHRRSAEYLADAERAVREERLRPTLYGGFVGVAWAAEHLGRGGDRLNRIDELLVEALGRPGGRWHFDLISGLVGIGCYALERLPRPAAARLCALVVERLADGARQRDRGVAWHTPAALMIPETAERFPDGYDNLGLAHGAPGVVSFLAGCCAAGVAETRARPLLDAAVGWILGQRLGLPGPASPCGGHPVTDPDRPARPGATATPASPRPCCSPGSAPGVRSGRSWGSSWPSTRRPARSSGPGSSTRRCATVRPGSPTCSPACTG